MGKEDLIVIAALGGAALLFGKPIMTAVQNFADGISHIGEQPAADTPATPATDTTAQPADGASGPYTTPSVAQPGYPINYLAPFPLTVPFLYPGYPNYYPYAGYPGFNFPWGRRYPGWPRPGPWRHPRFLGPPVPGPIIGHFSGPRHLNH